MTGFLQKHAPLLVALAASAALHVALVAWLPGRGKITVAPAPILSVVFAIPRVSVQPERVATPAGAPPQVQPARNPRSATSAANSSTPVSVMTVAPAESPLDTARGTTAPAHTAPERAAPVRGEPVARSTPDGGEADLLAGYGRALSQAIARRQRYPRIAQARGWEGTVEVVLQIAPGNRLQQIAVAHSSGFEVLDQHALEMVREAAPLPFPPEPLRQRDFNVRVPIVFRLKD